MVAWHVYFLAKLLLHVQGRLRLSPLADLLLLAAVVVPVPERVRRARAVIAWSAAATLAWSESWLPPPGAAWRFLTDPSVRPTLDYVLSFAAEAFDWRATAGLAALAFGCALAGRRGIRLTPLVLLGLAAAALMDPSALLGRASRALASFRVEERDRAVDLSGRGEPPFDIVILHVCSMSWDDLRAAGLSGEPFWDRFHAVLTRFNSATSYSNPASIRLLRAPCGQASHPALFAPAPAACYLLDALRSAGYRSWAANNHDGTYDHYAQVLKETAHADDPMSLDGVPVAMINFDDSPIYDDEAVLERWLRERARSGAARAALYYNTVSLHQGTRAPGRSAERPARRAARYQEVGRALFAKLERVFSSLEGSGRRAVVLLVAEHGAALEGSSVQAPDLRDLPLPSLTLVPAAVRLIGPGAPHAAKEAVDRPLSYLALAELLRRFMERPPFGAKAPAMDEYLRGLPETALVSENENSSVLRHDGRYWAGGRGKRWVALPSDASRDQTP